MNKSLFISALTLMVFVAFACHTTTKKAESSKNNDAVPAATNKAQTTFNQNQIMQAALAGKHNIVEDALHNGLDVNATDTNKRTLLMLAAFNGHTHLVEMLVAKGADVNLRDTIDRTALMFASTGPFAPTVLALLQAGAQPNLTDAQENWTAAMMAAAEGQLEVLKILVANGADLNMVDIDGESSLDFAKANGHSHVADYIASRM
ncbi:Ankyrin repeat-containing protein [Saccharicrinis carchari]|uniref:Ankyrin repeat-containing protein n=1 Tax=Saccharicrinis carchari TaxID=1168039 RepID=A0A521BFX1_SACCC|nr:ankyrin repeat domain-containing protein [Saccharicrinis carchari]SMO45993.1 Ankyrin repeat-containing protein [Saccharicrinis carchari]